MAIYQKKERSPAEISATKGISYAKKYPLQEAVFELAHGGHTIEAIGDASEGLYDAMVSKAPVVHSPASFREALGIVAAHAGYKLAETPVPHRTGKVTKLTLSCLPLAQSQVA